MKYIKRTLPFLLLILVLEIVASVIASYHSYGAWQFSDFYTKPMNWHIPVIFLYPMCWRAFTEIIWRKNNLPNIKTRDICLRFLLFAMRI